MLIMSFFSNFSVLSWLYRLKRLWKLVITFLQSGCLQFLMQGVPFSWPLHCLLLDFPVMESLHITCKVSHLYIRIFWNQLRRQRTFAVVFQLQICWLLWLIAMKDLRVTFFAWKIIVAILWLSASVVSPIYKKGEKLTQIHFLDSPGVLSLYWRPWDFFDLYFPVSSDPEL